jgi:acyl-CoA hydrolase
MDRTFELVLPRHANHHGTLFAGQAFQFMCRSAFLTASRHAHRQVVMAACREAVFHQPVRVGEALTVSSSIVRTGRSSMTVSVVGDAGRTESRESRRVMEATFEMVAVDADGRPAPIAALEESQ